MYAIVIYLLCSLDIRMRWCTLPFNVVYDVEYWILLYNFIIIAYHLNICYNLDIFNWGDALFFFMSSNVECYPELAPIFDLMINIFWVIWAFFLFELVKKGSHILLPIYFMTAGLRYTLWSCKQALPDSIARLEILEELRISSNLLTTLPDSIGLLLRLKYLDISSNKLIALPDSISNCR